MGDGRSHVFRRTSMSMYSLFLVLISSAGAVTLTGSSEYAVPGNTFNLICDVPKEAANVTFYRSPDLSVGSVRVSKGQCFVNDTSSLCKNVCACLPLGLGDLFVWVIIPTPQDHNSSWSCTAYNPSVSNSSSDSPFYILQVAKGPDASVSLSPPSTNYTRTEGSTLPGITCTADCRPSCTFVWTKPDNNNFTASPVLSLGQLVRSEHGTYRCTAWNEYGTNSAIVTVLVQYGPGGSISLSPSSTTYIRNESTTLPGIICTADCRPNCTFVWTKPDNTNFTASPVLSLGRLDRSEHGTYRCTAWNEYDTSSITVTVLVQYGPGGSVSLSPPTTAYVRNEDTTLPSITCTADCRPNCTFVWTKPDNTNFTVSYVLSLGRLDRSESGTYRCTAWNGYDTSTAAVTVLVQFPPTILSLTYVQGTADVAEKASTSLVCTVESNPSSTITWYYKATNRVLLTARDVLESTYTLTPAGCLDTGLYTCSARNNVSNTDTTMDKHINVLCKPRIDTRVNTITKIGVGLSKDLIIIASYLSNPAPAFTWQFHYQAMTEDIVHGTERISLRHTYDTTSLSAVSTLTRSNMEERWLGIYIVTVVNDQGSDTVVYTVVAADNRTSFHFTLLKVQFNDKPKPPYQGNAVCPFHDRAMLSWTSDFDGGSEQKFVVGMKADEQDSFVINTNNQYDDPGRGGIVNAEISGLVPDRFYIFNVIAINEFGNSTLVNEVNCTTTGVPVVEASNAAVVAAAVVVTLVVLIAAGAVIVFIFRRKIFAHFKKDDDTELETSVNRRGDAYDDLNPDEVGTYDQPGHEAQENPNHDGSTENTYEPLRRQGQDNPAIYEDLHAAEGNQLQSTSVNGYSKAITKSLQQSNTYVNVDYPGKADKPTTGVNPPLEIKDTEPTYVNADVKAGKKKKRKKIIKTYTYT